MIKFKNSGLSLKVEKLNSHISLQGHILIKGLFGIVSAFVSVIYVKGFILDAAFLEQFGFAHFELVGDALDYLAIGGIYLMFNFANHFVYIGIFTAIVGIG